MARYHKDVFLPPIRRRVIALEYSGHALEAAREDRYANLTKWLPLSVDTEQVLIVEMDTEVNPEGKEEVTKLLLRGTIDYGLDLCVVIVPKSGNTWTVKIVWANESRDGHRTLKNREAFEKGPRKP